MKKIIKAICFMVSAAILLTGCKGGKSPNKTAANVNPPGKYPIVDETITLRAVIPSNAFVEDFSTNEYTKYYEDLTNVHIEWEVVSGDVTQKKNIIFASGEYPDIFLNFGINPVNQVTYGKSGMLLALNDLIDQYAPNIVQAFKDNPGMREDITTPDGNIYGLPEVRYNYLSWHALKMWVYKPWLEKLNIEVPQTTEEFYNMLIAFRDKDPNGNGLKDEIPLLGTNEANDRSIFPFLISPFIYSGWGSEPSIVENGKVVFTADKPEYREALRYINRLYQEKLITSDSFTMNRQQRIAVGENPGDVILGCAPGMNQNMFTATGAEGRAKDYITIPPLEGPNGVRQVALCDAPMTGNRFNISATCKNPEAAIRWIDYFYTFKGYMESVYGMEGEGWRYAKQDELVEGFAPEHSGIFSVETMEGAQNKRWYQTTPTYIPKFFNIASEEKNILTQINEDEIRTKYEPYGQFKRVPYNLYMDEQQADEFAEYKTLIEDYVSQMRVQFVVGSKSLDTEWDAYVSELNKMGLEKYLKMQQEAYDEKGDFTEKRWN